jgi:hypothetical protein
MDGSGSAAGAACFAEAALPTANFSPGPVFSAGDGRSPSSKMAGTGSLKLGGNTAFAGTCRGDDSLLSVAFAVCDTSSAWFSGSHFLSTGVVSGTAGFLATAGSVPGSNFGAVEGSGGWAGLGFNGVANSLFGITPRERARGGFAFSGFGSAAVRVSPRGLRGGVFAWPIREIVEAFLRRVLEAFGFEIGV